MSNGEIRDLIRGARDRASEAYAIALRDSTVTSEDRIWAAAMHSGLSLAYRLAVYGDTRGDLDHALPKPKHPA